MNKIIIEYNGHQVEFYNIPYALARAFETILHHIEMDSDAITSECEVEE